MMQKAMFSPAPVTQRFRDRFSDAMAVRPSQLRAASMDGALMIPGAVSLRDRYGDLALPVTVMAGEGDRVVFARMARRLAAVLPGSQLRTVPGAGHMVHHSAPDQVVQAIQAVTAKALSVQEDRQERMRQSVPEVSGGWPR